MKGCDMLTAVNSETGNMHTDSSFV